MSVIDRVIAAVTPAESAEDRREARERARASAAPGDWLDQALDHHLQIESAFSAVRVATSAAERTATLRALALVLTGHANAEESVLYPALAQADEKGHATLAYSEQAAAKIQLGRLESLPRMSQDFLDVLEHLRGAVQHHMYEEESRWFLELRSRTPATEQDRLTARYREEFERYVGSLDVLLDEDDVGAPLIGAGRAGVDQDGASPR